METNQSWMANVEIIEAKLRKETWYNTFFAKFSGNVDISSDDNGNKVYRPSGNPIEVLNDFIAQGRDNMLVPFLSQLTGSPVYGDTVLKGTGEDQAMKWLRVFVNQTRKAVMKKSGSMSEQRQKIYKLYEAAKPQLSQWFTKWENQAIFQTFYEGASPNLTTGTNSDGLGLVRRYHPHWWINDGGVLTAIGTGAILMDLRVKCMELKIPHMVTKGGNPYWCLLLHPAQASALMQETEYKAAVRNAFSGKMLDQPELSGAVGYFAGFVIYEDIIGIREWDEAGYFFGSTTSARFDPTAVTLGAGSARVYNSIVFGKSAIGKGVAEDLHFTNEVDDHANTIEIGGASINGYNRNEYYAEGDATTGNGDAFENDSASGSVTDSALAAKNQSSLIFSTLD